MGPTFEVFKGSDGDGGFSVRVDVAKVVKSGTLFSEIENDLRLELGLFDISLSICSITVLCLVFVCGIIMFSQHEHEHDVFVVEHNYLFQMSCRLSFWKV